MKELEAMMQGMSEERKQVIRDKADRMEVYFNTAGVMFIKDKDDDCKWHVLQKDSPEYLTKVDKGVQL